MTKTGLGVMVVCAVMFAVQPDVSHADQREQARAEFQRGKQLYAQADYRGAIEAFAKADQLAPSPVLAYNIALCHERLGEKAEAVRRYRQYLSDLPSAANRTSVEAKISKLEADIAASTKRPKPPVVTPPEPDPPAEPEPDAEPPAVTSTGDPDLDRVAAVDVAAIRDQRQAHGGAAAGTYGGGPAGPPAPYGGQPAPYGGAPAPEPEQPKPVYKQWWFWVIIGVGTLVIISAATSNDSSSNKIEPLGAPLMPAAGPDGTVLFRF